MILGGMSCTLNFTYSGSGRVEFKYMLLISPVHILAPGVETVLLRSILKVSIVETLVLTSPS